MEPKTDMKTEQPLSATEAAKKLSVSVTAVSVWKTKGCPSHLVENDNRIRRRYFFYLREIKKWLEEQRIIHNTCDDKYSVLRKKYPKSRTVSENLPEDAVGSREICDMLNISRQTLNNWRIQEGMPSYIAPKSENLIVKRFLYSRNEVKKWLEERRKI